MVQSSRRVALVTGASSSIGLELAKVFAAHDYDLIISSSSRDHLIAVITSLREVDPSVQIETVVADLATPEGPHQLFEEVQKLGRPVDVLCNNAGIGVYGDFSRQTDLAEELKVVQVNAISPVVLTKLFVREMLARGSGKILFTASVVSVTPSPLQAVYGATKAFIYSFAMALRNELENTKITITALLPGATATNFFARAGSAHTQVAQNGNLDDPADVARAGFEALEAGDDHVVVTFKNKMRVSMAKILPPSMAAASGRVE